MLYYWHLPVSKIQLTLMLTYTSALRHIVIDWAVLYKYRHLTSHKTFRSLRQKVNQKRLMSLNGARPKVTEKVPLLDWKSWPSCVQLLKEIQKGVLQAMQTQFINLRKLPTVLQIGLPNLRTRKLKCSRDRPGHWFSAIDRKTCPQNTEHILYMGMEWKIN